MINKIILKYLLCFALIYSCQDNSKPNYQYMPNMYEAIGYDTYSESDAFSNGITMIFHCNFSWSCNRNDCNFETNCNEIIDVY